MLRWNLSSFIHRLNIVKDHNGYPTEISLLISNRSFWVSKLQKTKCSYALLTLLLFNCLWRGAKTWHKNLKWYWDYVHKTWLNSILVLHKSYNIQLPSVKSFRNNVLNANWFGSFFSFYLKLNWSGINPEAQWIGFILNLAVKKSNRSRIQCHLRRFKFIETSANLFSTSDEETVWLSSTLMVLIYTFPYVMTVMYS